MTLHPAILCCLLQPALAAQEPEVPLGLNLPTTSMMEDWRPGIRFTHLATTIPGTTAHQVLGGDYAGGPRPAGDWTLGFNLVRIF